MKKKLTIATFYARRFPFFMHTHSHIIRIYTYVVEKFLYAEPTYYYLRQHNATILRGNLFAMYLLQFILPGTVICSIDRTRYTETHFGACFFITPSCTYRYKSGNLAAWFIRHHATLTIRIYAYSYTVPMCVCASV